MRKEKKYPIGIQTFKNIIEGGYVYIDKTDLMWQMQNDNKYVFLSRPRRFGKSLLSSTFESFFLGEKDLFKGLKVEKLEKEWNEYAVIKLDLSPVKGYATKAELQNALILCLRKYTEIYGINHSENLPGQIFAGLIERIYKRTGKKVVIIIDEYDAPLLDIINHEDRLEDFRRVMLEFFQPIKASDEMIRFCFITGITKFSQLSIFSTLNNLSKVSMLPKYATICGITDKELIDNLSEDLQEIAEEQNITTEELHRKLKENYDGYHFAEYAPGVYNPFSLLEALNNRKIAPYWFETGTPSFLIKLMKKYNFKLTDIEDIQIVESDFDAATEDQNSIVPLLYQSGYLTIKEYDSDSEFYTLSIPNKEVRLGYTKGLLPIYSGLRVSEVQQSFAYKFWTALRKDDIDTALRELQTYLARLPYIEGFKQKLQDVSHAEGFYEWTLYLIFSMLNAYTLTQVKCSTGRIDMVVNMPSTIYIFEFKVRGSAEKALQQINSRRYDAGFQTDDKKIVKVGVVFSSENMNLKSWEIEK